MEIYFDNVATTRIDTEVENAIFEVNRDLYANPSAMHRAGFYAEEKVKESSEIIANIIGCDKSEIIWTSGGTESNNMVSGYTYEKLFADLEGESVPPLKAAEFVAYSYTDNTDSRNNDFSSYSSTQGYAQSVVDMNQISALKKKADAFAKAFISSDKKETALEILEKSLYFQDNRPSRHGFSPFSVDIYDFAVETEKKSDNKKLKSAAKALRDQIGKTVLLNLKKDTEGMWNERNNVAFSRSGGISVSLPRVPRRYY